MAQETEQKRNGVEEDKKRRQAETRSQAELCGGQDLLESDFTDATAIWMA